MTEVYRQDYKEYLKYYREIPEENYYCPVCDKRIDHNINSGPISEHLRCQEEIIEHGRKHGLISPFEWSVWVTKNGVEQNEY